MSTQTTQHGQRRWNEYWYEHHGLAAGDHHQTHARSHLPWLARTPASGAQCWSEGAHLSKETTAQGESSDRSTRQGHGATLHAVAARTVFACDCWRATPCTPDPHTRMRTNVVEHVQGHNRELSQVADAVRQSSAQVVVLRPPRHARWLPRHSAYPETDVLGHGELPATAAVERDLMSANA